MGEQELRDYSFLRQRLMPFGVKLIPLRRVLGSVLNAQPNLRMDTTGKPHDLLITNVNSKVKAPAGARLASGKRRSPATFHHYGLGRR